MAYSVTNLLTDIASATHGTNTNKIPNIYGIISRSARALLLDVDPKETQRIVQMSQVFNEVYDYPCPADMKGDRVIDIRPQGGRTPDEVFTQWYETNFDVSKGFDFSNKIYTQWNTGVKTMRIDAPMLQSPLVLTATNDVSQWITNGSNLTVDTTNSASGNGAIQVNTIAGTTYLDNSNIGSIDLSTYKNASTGFMWVYIPTGMTSVELQWGQNVSNYYTITATGKSDGTAFNTGWNLLSFPWVQTTTQVGSPTTTITYVKARLTYGSAQTDAKICNIVFSKGTYFDMVYYSKFLFRDPVTNVFQESVSSILDNDKLINLDTESYNLLFNKCAFYVAQSLQGADAGFDSTFWANEYSNALTRYRALNPSEAMVKATSYYTIPHNRYGRYFGGNLW